MTQTPSTPKQPSPALPPRPAAVPPPPASPAPPLPPRASATNIKPSAVPQLDDVPEKAAPALPQRRRASAGTESPSVEMRGANKVPSLDDEDDVSSEMEMASFKSDNAASRKRAGSHPLASSTSDFSDWTTVEGTPKSEQSTKSFLDLSASQASDESGSILETSLADSDTDGSRSLLTDSAVNSIFNQSTGQATTNPFLNRPPETVDPLSALANLGSSPPASSSWSIFGGADDGGDDFVNPPSSTPASQRTPPNSRVGSFDHFTPLSEQAGPLSLSPPSDQPYTLSSVPKGEQFTTNNPFGPAKPAPTPPTRTTTSGSSTKPSLSERFSRKVEKYSNKVADLIVSATAAPPAASSSVNGSSAPFSSSPPGGTTLASSPSRTSTSYGPSSASSGSSSSVTDDLGRGIKSAKKELKAAFSSFFGDDSSSPSSSASGKELKSVPKGKGSSSQEM